MPGLLLLASASASRITPNHSLSASKICQGFERSNATTKAVRCRVSGESRNCKSPRWLASLKHHTSLEEESGVSNILVEVKLNGSKPRVGAGGFPGFPIHWNIDFFPAQTLPRTITLPRFSWAWSGVSKRDNMAANRVPRGTRVGKCHEWGGQNKRMEVR